jgi:3-dehydroquinate dehydratase / shikimate dehydrogenase
MTRLCVSILVTELATAKRDIAFAIESGAEMIELRIDALPDAAIAATLLKACSVPCVVTCRAAEEGGQTDLSDAERIEILRTMIEGTACYCDAEFATLSRLRDHGLPPERLIVSSHNYRGRPARLYNLLEEMNEKKAAVSKVAWTPRSIRDCQEAFELLATRVRPTIAICMGAAGEITRILAKKFGAFLTFAAVREDAKTAPGQPTIEELKSIYRWDDQDADTAVYGVVGSPIKHSLSPAVHNAAFDHLNINAVYVPLLVNEGYESFKAFMETFVAGSGPLLLDGLSITIPHKENAYRYLAEQAEGRRLDTTAAYVRAVNTIGVHRTPDGTTTMLGTNTDYNAILDSIMEAMSIDRNELSRLRVGVIGAGGVGRTAVAALAAMGAKVLVFNRTSERADALVEEFDGRRGSVRTAPIGDLAAADCDVFLNATSLGMHPNVMDTPFDAGVPRLAPDRLVVDTVYNPARTRLLEQSAAAGAKTLSGMDIFLRQAAAQFELWTKQPAPMDVMRKAIRL